MSNKLSKCDAEFLYNDTTIINYEEWHGEVSPPIKKNGDIMFFLKVVTSVHIGFRGARTTSQKDAAAYYPASIFSDARIKVKFK